MAEGMQQNVPIDIGQIEKLIIALGQRTSAQNEMLRTMAECLVSIDASLRQLVLAANPAPNYQRPLSEYRGFDWASIGATVLSEDADGVSAVVWNDQVFTRRAPQNKFQEAIWYSRAAGKDAEGNNRYVRLITFKAAGEAEPIGAKAKRAITA